MSARKKTKKALTRHIQAMERSALDNQLKTAGIDSEPSRVAGSVKVAFDEDGAGGMGGSVQRMIPNGYEFNPKAIKPLARTLWAMSVALGHAMTAHRQFTKIKSSTISPDGLIGGRGYVMSVKDIRKALYDACESLSAISDSVHDELNAAHWKPKLAELEEKDVESVERLVGEAEQMMEDPEAEIADEMEEAEEEGPRADLDEDGNPEASEVPGGDDLADSVEPSQVKMASSESMSDRLLRRFSNSSLPVQTLPGPRVQHLDRGDVDQQGPGGSYNTPDEWDIEEPKGPTYQSEWSNEFTSPRAPTATTALPSDWSPTGVQDFGLGYGEDGAGLNHGVGDPHSVLPASQWKTELPQDVLGPVVRTDYYPDGDIVAESSLPAPVVFDYESEWDVPAQVSDIVEPTEPYIKWDYTTHNMRPDHIYQRDAQGPREGED